MGEKGARHSEEAAASAERLVAALQPLGPVESKKMFGGHGIFLEGVMFALVDSSGQVFLRSDAEGAAAFEDAGGRRHGRMPYWSVPDPVLADPDRLPEWGARALAVAREQRKG